MKCWISGETKDRLCPSVTGEDCPACSYSWPCWNCACLGNCNVVLTDEERGAGCSDYAEDYWPEITIEEAREAMTDN
jgi:hypothetical protein